MFGFHGSRCRHETRLTKFRVCLAPWMGKCIALDARLGRDVNSVNVEMPSSAVASAFANLSSITTSMVVTKQTKARERSQLSC